VNAPASTIVTALERIWAAIRRRHPQVPPAVVIVGPGDSHRRRIWGHFAPDRWAQKASVAAEATTVRINEVLLAGESLERSPIETIGTLLHEAAHALAAARGIDDTSRRGQYHNGKFKKLAAELGLDVAKDPRIGWSLTTVTPATAATYATEVAVLREAQEATANARRCWADKQDEEKRRRRTTWLCACRPEPVRVVMTKKDGARGPIICAACETAFMLEADDDA
jgi:hypothetical protein